MPDNNPHEHWWRRLLTGNRPPLPLQEAQFVFSLLPGHTRCKFCKSPFDGAWLPLVRLVGRGPSRLAAQLCHQCQVIASQHLGGAEVELTLLFADVRGSTRLGEQLTAVEFSQLISRFFSVSTRVLFRSGAWVDKLVGDQVLGMYLPHYAGPNHISLALQAAQELLRETGHGAPAGPWIEVGVGIHTGQAYIGTVGSPDGATDITVLGDVPNVAARLSSAAGPGEIIISEDAYQQAQLSLASEQRLLELKGKSQPMPVHVLAPPVPAPNR